LKNIALYSYFLSSYSVTMATAAVSRPVGQPDIAYTPDFDKYQARTNKRLATEKLDRSLPPGFPEKLKSDFVWEGQNVAEKYDWVYELNEKEKTEIEQALEYFKCS
jgi:hypothetical protein